MGQSIRERAKWLLRRSLKAGGWSIRRHPTLIDFLRDRGVDLVIDVGANVGQFASELRAWGYRGSIVSFEPGKDAFGRLVEAAKNDTSWQPIKKAMGREPGSTTLDITRSTVFSSFRKQAQAASVYGSDADVIGQEQVEVETLDNFLASRNELSIFIKIDTQGFESEVIAGLSRNLEKVVGVQLELPVVQFYNDSWTLDGAISLMKSKGYEMAQVVAVNHRKDDPVSATELDCVFRRAV